MNHPVPCPQKEFAESVVRQLRNAGYHALWAGGCVRDALMGKTPKDYDVASTATPDEVIRLFGKNRTIPVGASFGVVMVLGPARAAGQIEVATFRSDGEYHDGRRPTDVRFCSPEEDAQRRDFTINGMFFDPIANQVIDYVGGREDLSAGIVRAIGNPSERFAEDKLRMLRAVRFAATMGFSIDEETLQAIRILRSAIVQVSVERIAQELRRMLAHHSRQTSVALLHSTHLLPEILPEFFESNTASQADADIERQHVLEVLGLLKQQRFEPALAALFTTRFGLTESGESSLLRIENACRRIRLSNDETECVVWLARSVSMMATIRQQPLHVLKPLLADNRSELLLDLADAMRPVSSDFPSGAEFCRDYLRQSNPALLAPVPFLSGRDLQQLGLPPGKTLGTVLKQLRIEQLDEQLNDRAAAVTRAQELIASQPEV